MARAPLAGRVKTRLARDIGTVAATWFYRHAMAHVLARVGRDSRWCTVVAVSPDGALDNALWPAHAVRMAQGPGDLGTRMQRVFDRLPPGPAVIIGTDIPEIRSRHIAAAFRALGAHDAVLGPGADGGYWLVGLRRSPRVRSVFGGVRWSSPHTLSDTRANLGTASVALLETLEDVDNGPGHRRLGRAGSRIVLPSWWRPGGP